MFDRHLVEQDREDSLLHLAGILGTKDDHLFLGKIDGDAGGAAHASGIAVGWEAAGIVDHIVGVESLQLFSRWSDEHVPHEQSMVGARTNDTHVDSVFLVPSCIAINNIYSAPGVEVVDSTFTVDFPYLQK